MRLPLVLLVFLTTVNVYAAQAQAVPGKKIFLLNNSTENWCAFSSEAEWRSAVDSQVAKTVAVAEYSGGRMSKLYLTFEDDPGAQDWAVFDIYTLASNKQLQSLERTINVLPGHFSKLENWRIENGKILKKTSVVRDLTTLEPKTDEDWAPEMPVFARLNALPFWPLIRGAQNKEFPPNGTCITVRLPPPVPPPPPKPVKAWKTYVDRFGWTIEYPATWTVESSCPTGCPAPGEAVGFSNPETARDLRISGILVSSMTDALRGRSIAERLSELKHNNVNEVVSETPTVIDGHPALTMRYRQPESEMETTYLVTDSAYFEIHISSVHWKIEQLTDFQVYRHMLSSFKFPKATL